MESVSAWRFANPPEAFIRGVLVDSEGQRICNEMLYGAQIAERMIKHHNGKGYLIIDAGLFSQALKELGPGRSMWFQAAAALMYLFLERKKGQTLNELARKLNMPFETLNHTIHDYNAILDGDQPDPMGKPRSHITKVQQGPYYALNVSYDSMIVPCPSLSLGGLKVDEKTGQVLSVDNQPISGLYAAGRSAVGIASRSYVSGLSIADCVYSGRRAGKHAAGADCKSE
jgi:3-oxo-5alpha-steroid 4-dehydrogenase